MKRLCSVLILLCVLLSAGCGKEDEAAVVTFEPDATIEKTTYDEAIDAVVTVQTDADAVPKTASYEVTYCTVEPWRDSVGNAWLDAVAAIKNTGEENIRLTDCCICVYADGEQVITLANVVCYPSVLQPGEVGYCFEQTPGYVDDECELCAEFSANAERGETQKRFIADDSQVYDAAFGVEVRGAFSGTSEGLLCVVAVLFDAEQKPFAVLCDYLEAGANEFALSSDKLHCTKQDVASHVVYVYPYEN